jgi:hypothetical protein
MRLDTRFLGWGVFFIVAGGLALAVRSGYLAPDVASQLWRLWPLVLVGFGVGVLLGRTQLAWLGGLVVAATFGLIVGGALAGGLDRVGCTGSGGGAGSTVGGQLADGASVSIESACGDLTISSAAGSAWSLTYRGDPAPTVEQAPDRLRISSPPTSFLRQSGWDITLPSDPHLNLDVTASAGGRRVSLPNTHLSSFHGTFNAGSFDVDLSGATVGGVAMTLNAGSGTLRLPTGTYEGHVQVNAGSLTVCVQPDAGLRIHSGGAISSTDFSGSGLTRGADDEWLSPGVDTAATVIRLSIDANAASVTLRRDGGCS